MKWPSRKCKMNHTFVTSYMIKKRKISILHDLIPHLKDSPGQSHIPAPSERPPYQVSHVVHAGRGTRHAHTVDPLTVDAGTQDGVGGGGESTTLKVRLKSTAGRVTRVQPFL